MQAVYIVAAVRTPIGSFGGNLAQVAAPALGAAAIRGACQQAGIAGEEVEEVLMGNVISANLGQAPARQAARLAGLPDHVPCTAVNKVCASGMKAVMLGAQAIQTGYADVVVAGGMENMSSVPYYLPQARWGYRYGDNSFVDGLSRDGLTDVYDQCAMGVFADRTATRYGISREEQDAYATDSYRRAAAAADAGFFRSEIVPVSLPPAKGGAPVQISEDEEFRKVKFDKIPSLRPVFTPDGTVTAANASTINDGAAAIVLMSERKLKDWGGTPLARVVAFADAAQEPAWFTTTPVVAAEKALRRAGLSRHQMDYFEVNEAFSVVALAFEKLLDVPHDRTNVFGGAVSLGHPLGASGSRILTTLRNVLQHHGASYGLAAICNGGGGASALILEKC